jgi:chromosome segregation ATPase
MTESADQTQAGIRSLLRQLDNQKQKALEESFIELNSNFQSIFSQIVPGGSAELKLVKQDAENES